MFIMKRLCSRSAFMSRPQANAKVMVEDADFEKAQNLDGRVGGD